GRPPRERPRSRRVALDHGHVSPGRIEPTVLRAGLESVKEAGGTLEPAVGDRALAAQDEIVVAEPDGEHRRTLHVSLPPAEPVGALARLDAGGHVLDPPRSPTQALQRLHCLAPRELLLEDRPRLVPRAAGQRGLTLPNRLAPGRDLGHRRTV